MSDLPINPDTGELIPDPDGLTEEGAEAVGQRLRIRLLLFKGESEFFPDDGVDYYRYILGKNLRLANLNMAFVPEILKTPGVREIAKPIDYTFDKTNRVLHATVEVTTTTGETVTVEV